LGLFDLPHSIIWRISSLIAALLMGSYVLTFPARRREVTNIPVPTWALVIYVLQLVVVAFLLMIAAELFIKPAAGPFAVGVTAFLLMSFIAYIAQLAAMLRGPLDKKKHK
jgi:drug/metabolite transporter (DMT)-like permease